MVIIIKKLFIWLLLMDLSIIEGYRILGIFPFNAKSHNIIFNKLMKGLAERGHQVDVVTHFPLENPPSNYNVMVNLNGTLEKVADSYTFDLIGTINVFNTAYLVAELYGNRLCRLMGLKEMQDFIKNPPNDPPYDLVITEVFGANCFIGFGHYLNVPVIAISTTMEYPWIMEFTGSNNNLAVLPNIFITTFDRKNFWYRLKNVIAHHWYVCGFHYFSNDEQTRLMRKYLSPDIPNIRVVERSVALTLINSHPAIYDAKPQSASLVEISGLHIEENGSKLPNDLKEWLDNGTDGVIYFSFGSFVLMETLPVETLQNIYKFIEEIAPIRVLMKIMNKDELPPGLPDNVFFSSWIPQQAVLAHENVRVFITHGGLMGCQEALYFGVPMIGIPLFADQHRNIEALVAKNMSIALNVKHLTTDNLVEAVTTILTDPKYRPISPMETAIYWIEFVIRHGSDTLGSPSLDLYWWQLALLDVYSFLLVTAIASFLAISHTIRYMYSSHIIRKPKLE